MIATVAANRPQQEKRKHVFLKETARAGAIRLPGAAFPAVKFEKKPSPRRRSKRRHDIPPAARVFIINPANGE